MCDYALDWDLDLSNEEEEFEEEDLDSSYFVTESHPILAYADPEALDFYLPI